MREVFQSPSADERLRIAADFLARVPADAEVLVVGATRGAADDLARRLTAARGASFGVHCASLAQLAMRVAAAELARLGAAPATALGAQAIAARVSFEAAHAGALPYFAPVARLPGFARALAATLAELRLAGAAQPVPRAGSAGAAGPAADVAELARRFEAQLDAAGIADRAAVLTVAARAAEAGALGPLGQVPMVLLDVPLAAPAEAAFVEALASGSPAVLATVPAGDDATVTAL